MKTWVEAIQDPRFAKMSPTQQLTFADDVFHQTAASLGLDPGQDEYQDRRNKWRMDVMPDLKVGQRSEKPTAQNFSGEQVPVDELGWAAQAGHGLANTFEKIGLGANKVTNAMDMFGDPERAAELGREEISMRNRQAPIDETMAGTAGGVLPALALPMGGPMKVVQGVSKVPMVVRKGWELLKSIAPTAASGAAYGALTGEGQNIGRNALEGGAAFAGGDVLGRVAGAGLRGAGAGLRRFRYPEVGGKQVTRATKARAASRLRAVDELESKGFNLTAGQRSGNRALQGLESVFPELVTTSGRAGRKDAGNKVKLNELVAKSFGKDKSVASKGVLDEEVFSSAASRLGRELDSALPAGTRIPPSAKMAGEFDAISKDLDLGLDNPKAQEVRDTISKIYGKFTGQEGKTGVTEAAGMSVEQYKKINSQLTSMRRRLFKEDRESAMQVGKIQGILEKQVERSLKDPAALKAFRQARAEWGGLRIAEDSVDEFGDVQLGKLKDAVKRHRPQDLVSRKGRQRSDLGTLAKHVKVLQQAIPDSGTPIRTGARQVLTGGLYAGQGALGLYGGQEAMEGNLFPAAASILGPIGIQRLLYNPKFAKYLTQAAPEGAGGMSDALAKALRLGGPAGGYAGLEQYLGQ